MPHRWDHDHPVIDDVRGMMERTDATTPAGSSDVDEFLKQLVCAWDGYRLGEVARLMVVARERVGLTVPERNKDR